MGIGDEVAGVSVGREVAGVGVEVVEWVVQLKGVLLLSRT